MSTMTDNMVESPSPLPSPRKTMSSNTNTPEPLNIPHQRATRTAAIAAEDSEDADAHKRERQSRRQSRVRTPESDDETMDIDDGRAAGLQGPDQAVGVKEEVSDEDKKKRKRLSTEQMRALMEVFQKTDNPSSEVKEQLADHLGMTPRDVHVWFHERRTHLRSALNQQQKAAANQRPAPPPPRRPSLQDFTTRRGSLIVMHPPGGEPYATWSPAVPVGPDGRPVPPGTVLPLERAQFMPPAIPPPPAPMRVQSAFAPGPGMMQVRPGTPHPNKAGPGYFYPPQHQAAPPMKRESQPRMSHHPQERQAASQYRQDAAHAAAAHAHRQPQAQAHPHPYAHGPSYGYPPAPYPYPVSYVPYYAPVPSIPLPASEVKKINMTAVSRRASMSLPTQAAMPVKMGPAPKSRPSQTTPVARTPSTDSVAKPREQPHIDDTKDGQKKKDDTSTVDDDAHEAAQLLLNVRRASMNADEMKKYQVREREQEGGTCPAQDQDQHSEDVSNTKARRNSQWRPWQ